MVTLGVPSSKYSGWVTLYRFLDAGFIFCPRKADIIFYGYCWRSLLITSMLAVERLWERWRPLSGFIPGVRDGGREVDARNFLTHKPFRGGIWMGPWLVSTSLSPSSLPWDEKDNSAKSIFDWTPLIPKFPCSYNLSVSRAGFMQRCRRWGSSRKSNHWSRERRRRWWRCDKGSRGWARRKTDEFGLNNERRGWR